MSQHLKTPTPCGEDRDPRIRRLLLAAAAWMFVFTTAYAQMLTDAPRFDVATIKPARGTESTGFRASRGRLETVSTSIIDLMKFSYGVHAAQILGMPEPLQRERFDVVGTVAGQEVNITLVKSMMRTLLADRFHLHMHPDRKELPVYVLEWEKAGSELKPAAHELLVPTVGYGPGVLEAGDASMHDLATFLQRYVTDRPVLDQTHKDGKYDLQLHWTPDNAAAQPANATQEYPDLFTAIRQQLGLRLVAKREMADVLVIDNVTVPTDN